MISKLEKTTSVLFATLIALSTPNCGGGGGGGSGDNDAGNDVTATEETTGPECYSHAECGDDYICVEGDCESIDQACALRPNAECDENSRFEGIYAITSSTCPLILEGTSFSYIVFDDNQDCRFVNVLGLTNIGSEPVCLESEFEGPRPTGNFLMTAKSSGQK